MFAYEFMQRAFIVAVCISIITPLIGSIIVLKGLSNMGEALSHTALAGITLGLILGIDPIIGAVCFALLAAFSIEFISRWFKGFSEMSTTIVLSTGIGLASILSGFVKNASTLNSYMFGSIVAVTPLEVWLTLGLSLVVILIYLLNYKNLFMISFDSEFARLSGVKIKRTNFIIMICCAITVALACRTVGALIVSSLMVIPVACSFKLAKSYKHAILLAILFAFMFTILGLTISFYCNVKPGGAIVLIGVAVLVLLSLVKKDN